MRVYMDGSSSQAANYLASESYMQDRVGNGVSFASLGITGESAQCEEPSKFGFEPIPEIFEESGLVVGQPHGDVGLPSLVIQLLQKNAFLARLSERIQKHVADGNAKENLAEIAGDINSHLGNDSEWGAFDQCFGLLQNGFPERLRTQYPALTTAEAKVAALIRVGLSSKEIGSLLFIASRTVDVHRLHARRKLGLDPYQSLEQFLTQL